MIKRFISGILVLLMLGTVIAGCSQKSNDEIVQKETDKNSRTTATLSMYLMSEEKISAEQVAKTEAAVNRITKSKFKIQLKLRYFTEDEYYAELEKAMANYRVELEERTKKNTNATTTSTKSGETVAEETYLNEFGIPELVYPTISDNQVDIFYFGGYDKFAEYRKNENLARLDNELTSSSKLLTSYIAPAFLTYIKSVAGGTYAIPNNRAVGEYTCLVMNKEILKDLSYLNEQETTNLETMFTSLTCAAVEDVLKQVKEDPAYSEIIPLYMGKDEIPVSGVRYFGMGDNGRLSGSFSVIGGTYSNSWLYKTKDQYTRLGNILGNSDFLAQARKYTEYKEKGYVDFDSDKDFAIGYVKGNADVFDRFDSDKYVTVVLEYPTITTADVFEHMFGVFEKTASVSKSMEIITYLNTNEDFRNLIQYGISGENYELVDVDDADGNSHKVVKMLSNTYNLDPAKTGNNLILYPVYNKDLANVREYERIQLRALKVSLIMGLDLIKFDTKTKNIINVAEKSMLEIKALSEEIYEELLSATTVEELNTAISAAYSRVSGNMYVQIMLYESYEPSEDTIETYGEGTSLAAFYKEWLVEMGIYTEPKDD